MKLIFVNNLLNKIEYLGTIYRHLELSLEDKKMIKIIQFIIFILLSYLVDVAAQIYNSTDNIFYRIKIQTTVAIFVDADNASGPWDGTEAHPYQTISDGLAIAASGSKVIVKEGIYHITQNLTINNGVTLFMHPGVINQYDDGTGIQVFGTLQAFATAEDSIVFTRFKTSGATWGGIHFTNTGSSSELRYCRIEYANGANGKKGGALFCRKSSPRFYNCLIQHNEADYGAGLYCENGSSPEFANCTISNNSAAISGGGIFSHESSPIVYKNYITQNYCEGFLGGTGVVIYDDPLPSTASPQRTQPSLSKSIVGSNSLGQRSTPSKGIVLSNNSLGGLLSKQDMENSLATIESTHRESMFKDLFGKVPVIEGNTFADNATSAAGGTLLIRNRKAIIYDNSFLNNRAKIGAGIHMTKADSTYLAWNVFEDNRAALIGGAIYADSTDNANIERNLLLHNEAIIGAGIYLQSTNVNITNNTLFSNHAQSYANSIYAAEGNNAVINSVLWDTKMTEITQIVGSGLNIAYSNIIESIRGNGNISSDPFFVDTTRVGFYPQISSPCINAGDPSSPKDPDGSIADIGVHYFHGLFSEIYQLKFTSLPNNIATNEVSDELVITAMNYRDEPLKVEKDVTIRLSSTSSEGEFSLSSDPFVPTDSLIIPVDQSSASFYYRDGRRGKPIVSATARAAYEWMDAKQEQHIGSDLGPILFVWDGKDWYSKKSYYESALTASGFDYNVWDVEYQGDLPKGELFKYQSPNQCVVWVTGDLEMENPYSSYVSLTSNDRNNITDYLNGGGRLFISGQDIGYEVTNNTYAVPWYNSYLYAKYVQNDTRIYELSGSTGDPIGDGLHLSLFHDYYYYYPSEIDPIFPARPVFTYGLTSRSSISYIENNSSFSLKYQNLIKSEKSSEYSSPQGIISSGTAGLRVDTGIYKLVYFAFGFEHINNSNDRNLVMERIILWLTEPKSFAPQVKSILPDVGMNTRPIDIVSLSGFNFQIGAKVKLSKEGENNIYASDVNVLDSNKIACNFNLIDAAIGEWDVVVENPKGGDSGESGEKLFSIDNYALTYPPKFSWSKNAGGSGRDIGWCICTDDLDNAIIAGGFEDSLVLNNTTLKSNGSGDIIIAKYDASGGLVWAQSMGGVGNDIAYGITSDKDGNIYITGLFTGSINFGKIKLTTTSNSNWDVFVAKLDSRGKVQWAKQTDGNSYVIGKAIALDNSNNVIVTGVFWYSANFSPYNLSGVMYDVFIAKYDRISGKVIWAKSAGGPLIDYCHDVTTDGNDNILITGIFEGKPSFGSIGLAGNQGEGDYDLFLAKYNSDGKALWAKQANGFFNDNLISGFDYGLYLGGSISTDSMDDILICGSFSETVSFDTITLSSAGNFDAFLAKYSVDGNIIWAKRAGGRLDDYGWGMNTLKNGNSVLTGGFRDIANFGPLTLTSRGNEDIFVAEYDSTGHVLWIKQGGGKESDRGYDVSSDNKGNILISGYSIDTAHFDETTLLGEGSFDIFIAELVKEQTISPKISGSVTYYSNANSVSDATLNLSGGASVSKNTDLNGYYEFTNLLGLNDYTVTPIKDNVQEGVISMYDAAKAAQIAANLIDPTPDQFTSTDVDKSGTILMSDASLIAMYVANLPPPEQSFVGEWFFNPGFYSYYPLVRDKNEQNFTGILLGDVDGNWSQVNPLAKSIIKSKNYLALTDMWGLPGEQISVHFSADKGEKILSWYILFKYDPSILKFKGLKTSALIKDFQIFTNVSETGELKLGGFSTKELVTPGTFLEIEFDVIGEKGESCVLDLEKYAINSDILKSMSSKFEVGNDPAKMPKLYALFQNFPNPFNPSTTIKYQLPKDSYVNLEIYDILGKTIKSLVNEKQSAGYYSLQWNGQDDQDIPLPSGVYLCRIKAGNFHDIKKLMLIK